MIPVDWAPQHPLADPLPLAALHGVTCALCFQPLQEAVAVGRVTDTRTYGRPYEFTVYACRACQPPDSG